MDDMLETMYAAPGIGLAAPQVGVPSASSSSTSPRTTSRAQPLKLANPEILWVSDDDAVFEEGCLSVPEHYAEVARPAAARMRYLDDDNEIREIEAVRPAARPASSTRSTISTASCSSTT